MLICAVQKGRLLKKVGKKIVELRTKKGLSQRQLAFECGKDPQSLERVENGKSNPTIFYLYEVSRALDVPLKDLIDI